MSWTDESDARLRELWDSGLSASAIGGILGVSRNAVLGRVHRLKLRSRRGAPGVKTVRAVRPAAGGQQRRSHFGQPSGPGVLRRAAARAESVAQKDVAAEEGEATVALGPHQCKWPVGDPRAAGFGFCGQSRDGGQWPYCAAHRARATRVPEALG